jgi:hypothetical protein
VTRRLKTVVWVVVGLPLAGLATLCLVFWRPGESYEFLVGHPLLLTTVQGEMGGGGGGYDVRVYCWHEDFFAVHGRVAKELESRGFKEQKAGSSASSYYRASFSRMAFWTRDGRTAYVSVVAGRARDYKEARNLPSADTSWVTVTVGSYLKDGPYVWIRKALPHQEY